MNSLIICFSCLLQPIAGASSADNVLSPAEKEAGWRLLFDGKTLDGWVTSEKKPSKRPVEADGINPHLSGHYMMIREEEWSDFVLSLDFKITKGCNSGIFVRTSPLTPLPGKDVGYNGLEIAIDDTAPGADFHDTGAIYDLVKPRVNAMKPILQWNHIEVTCDGPIIRVVLNGEAVTEMDLDRWTEKGKRPDGSAHKFEFAYKDHPRKGYLGLQDHGSDCWFKNIKVLPLGPWQKGEADRSLEWARKVFTLDSSSLPARWRGDQKVESFKDREVRTLTFSDSEAGLTAVTRATISRDGPELEWTGELTNQGKKDIQFKDALSGLERYFSPSFETASSFTEVSGPLPGYRMNMSDGGALILREAGAQIQDPDQIVHPGASLRPPRQIMILWSGKDPSIGDRLLRQVTDRRAAPTPATGK
jgi:alpha-3'-ketoglucosidase